MGALDDILKSIAPEQEPQQDTLVDPIDYGNGVLYFDCIREQFAKSLSVWIGAHENAIVVAVAPNMENYASGTQHGTLFLRGYIVVFYHAKR